MLFRSSHLIEARLRSAISSRPSNEPNDQAKRLIRDAVAKAYAKLVQHLPHPGRTRSFGRAEGRHWWKSRHRQSRSALPKGLAPMATTAWRAAKKMISSCRNLPIGSSSGWDQAYGQQPELMCWPPAWISAARLTLSVDRAFPTPNVCRQCVRGSPSRQRHCWHPGTKYPQRFGQAALQLGNRWDGRGTCR